MSVYLPVLMFLAVAVAVALGLMLVPRLLNPLRKTPEKLSPYECGFEPFEAPRHRFDVRFYLVAILFIVFDLEVAFLFPWAMVLQSLSWYGFGSMMLFLGVLTVGFIYEWKKGALDY